MTTKIQHRITSLERWGMRIHADFQPESVACIRDAGFTGVLVNGGSGIGPDMLTPESLVESEVITDLMPYTVKSNRQEMKRRCDLLKEVDLKPWLCLWGVPGPDESAGSPHADSNRFFDRRSKLEMKAKLMRTPELFGQRDPADLSWRGSRPLCVSHPYVQTFYRELMTKLTTDYPELEGIFFFPGDNGADLCDDFCPRCKATGLDTWDRVTNYVNELFEALIAVKPDFSFNFTLWNLHKPGDDAIIGRLLDKLHPGIGICMSMTDNNVDPRKSGPMTFNQPWVNWVKPGELFLNTVARAHSQNRPVMVLGEISQGEVWDPVCHNMPNPKKVLGLLRNSEDVPGANAICDFWGHRAPFHSHANHAAMRAYYADPSAEDPLLLRRAAIAHYSLPPEQADVIDAALSCWQGFDATVDDWALGVWGQRFSYAIGRDAARGILYRAFIPVTFREFNTSWPMSAMRSRDIDTNALAHFQIDDRIAFLKVAATFDELAERLKEAALYDGASIAHREARNIELAGELLASEGRTILATDAYNRKDADALRGIIEAEIEGRIRQQEITGRIGWGAGINPILVDEDIQNMRLYLSCDDFPNTPDDTFSFTATPYTG